MRANYFFPSPAGGAGSVGAGDVSGPGAFSSVFVAGGVAFFSAQPMVEIPSATAAAKISSFFMVFPCKLSEILNLQSAGLSDRSGARLKRGLLWRKYSRGFAFFAN